MKQYVKHEIPIGYRTWFEENNDRLQKSELDEEGVFNRITSKLKRTLQRQLLIEQGYICAYCGKRIGKINNMGFTFSVDHFESKFCNRHLVLVYTNLLGTCKMSEIRSFKVDLASIKTIPKTFRNIALEKGIDTEDFTGKGWIKDDDDLVALNIAEVTYRDIPLHCDDNKEDRLKNIGWKAGVESSEIYIINPTKIDNCDTFFSYSRGGQITVSNSSGLSDLEKLKVINTITVFNLDNPYLRSERTNAYIRAERVLAEFQNQAKIDKKDFSIDDIENEILETVYTPDDEGKLAPYCFVTAYVLRTFL
jgi:hypothetical protein